MGGCLTPIGDPPLLMGFMRGVPFFWSMHLLPILTFNLVILLFVFYHLDKRHTVKILRKEENRISADREPNFISKDCTILFYLQHFCHLRQQTVPSVQRTILRGERSKRLQFCLSEFLLLCSRH